MAETVRCRVCRQYEASPPGDECKHCGAAYDPDLVRRQRAAHGLDVASAEQEQESEQEPAAKPATRRRSMAATTAPGDDEQS